MQSNVWTEQCMLYLSTLRKPFGIPMDSPASVGHLPETGYHNLVVSLWQLWVLINTSQPAYWAFCSEYRSELRMYHVSCTFLSRDWVLRNVTKGKRKDMTSILKHLGYSPTQHLQKSTFQVEDRAHQRKSDKNWLVCQYLRETGLIYEDTNKSQRAAVSRNQASEILITIFNINNGSVLLCESDCWKTFRPIKTNLEIIERSKYLLFITYIGRLRYNYYMMINSM